MEVTFDPGRSNRAVDLRPAPPIILRSVTHTARAQTLNPDLNLKP
jgi:hypothetical protein